MGKRRRSREIALQVLYQLEIAEQDPGSPIDQLQAHFFKDRARDEFCEFLVRGVLAHRKEIDQLLKKHSEHWRLDRMAVIDRAILRMATFELLYCEEIPPKVTLNEAIDLGKRYSSEESGNFINGILDQMQKEVVRKPAQLKTISSCEG